MKPKLLLYLGLLCLGALTCHAQNQNVINPPDRPVPIVTGTTGTAVKSSALEASKVLKSSSGTLVDVSAHSTKGTAQYILLIDAASVPSNGAVTLLYPPIWIAANGNISLVGIPLKASSGIVVANSSTDTFTLTAGSADCIYNAHVR